LDEFWVPEPDRCTQHACLQACWHVLHAWKAALWLQLAAVHTEVFLGLNLRVAA
jgi:hypothetical protein